MENVFFLIVSKCFSSGLHDFEMLFQWTTTINNFNKNWYISISWFDIRFLLYQRKNSRICVNDSRQLCSLSAGLLSVNQTIKRFSWRSWICHGRPFDRGGGFSLSGKWTSAILWRRPSARGAEHLRSPLRLANERPCARETTCCILLMLLYPICLSINLMCPYVIGHFFVQPHSRIWQYYPWSNAVPDGRPMRYRSYRSIFPLLFFWLYTSIEVIFVFYS